MKRLIWLLASCLAAWAQAGPTATPQVVPTFLYVMNSGAYPAAQTVKVTLPTTLATLPIVVSNATSSACGPGMVPPCGWLAVSPDQGHSPLTLTVSANPTGLSPGSYTGSFVVDTSPGSGHPVTVTAALQISNPPSTLSLSSTSTNYQASSSGSSVGALSFSYTTGAAQDTLIYSQLDISSTGDIIPFNVSLANTTGSGSTGGGSTAVWLRVSSTSPTQGASLTTSGSAGVGSLVPIFVTIDYATLQGLGIGQYFATITIAAASNPKVNGTMTVAVTLVVSAGAPTVNAVFPGTLTPAPPIDPVFTIYGTNFTLNTSVFLDVYIDPLNPGTPISHQITTNNLTLVSPKILQAKVSAAFLPAAPAGVVYPYSATFRIVNASFPPVTTNSSITVTDPTLPSISVIVNSASYMQMSRFIGTGLDPGMVPPNAPTAISPRGVISIFGQNLGPAVVSTAAPAPAVGLIPSYYLPQWSGIQVLFSYTDPVQGVVSLFAPILMVYVNQINCIVPGQLANVLGSASTGATVTVFNNGQPSLAYPVTILAADPGIFTFGGLGQGQGAIINYDANGAATINSSTNQEPRGNIVAIFATGLGTLAGDNTILDGAITSATAPGVHLSDEMDVQVTVGGQPAVVLYAGTSPGAVAGLVQVNAIIPPTSSTGSVPLSLTIGPKPVTRQAQNSVTVAVKK